jgi:hypothetical protein
MPTLSANAALYWRKYIEALEHFSFGLTQEGEEVIRGLLDLHDLPLYLKAFCHLYLGDGYASDHFYHSVEAAKVSSRMAELAPRDRGVQVFLHRAQQTLEQALQAVRPPLESDSPETARNGAKVASNDSNNDPAVYVMNLPSQEYEDVLAIQARVIQQILEYQNFDMRHLDESIAQATDAYFLTNTVNRRAQDIGFAMDIEIAETERRPYPVPPYPKVPIYPLVDVLRHISKKLPIKLKL